MTQLPLRKGDAVFFNPACFHQAGDNTLPQPRVANLLQVSACWGRPMEFNDRLAMTRALWPVIKRWSKELKKGNGDGYAESDLSGFYNGHTKPNGVNGDNRSSNLTGQGGISPARTHSRHHPQELEALIDATCDDYGFPRRIDMQPVCSFCLKGCSMMTNIPY